MRRRWTSVGAALQAGLLLLQGGAPAFERLPACVEGDAPLGGAPAVCPLRSLQQKPRRIVADGYDRRRYVLLCLACAVLERADPQITLRILGERLLSLAAEPELAALGFSFTLTSRQERSELVSVCRTLLALGVLGLVAGEEEAFVQGFMQPGMPSGGEHADALYDAPDNS